MPRNSGSHECFEGLVSYPGAAIDIFRCKDGVNQLLRYLKSSNSAQIHNGVLVLLGFVDAKYCQVLESLVKNCSMRFHYEIASKEFVAALMRLLKRV
jgi:hypothetical protein